MKKYLSVFRISLQQEFAYRLSFVMWRVRNIVQISLLFFLWSTVFSEAGREVFGYDREKILTYIFGILIIKAIVFSARTVDVASDISSGDITNYLLKPISYLKYWFTRDMSSKVLNLLFACVETMILFFILKPPFFFQTDPIKIFFFIFLLAVAILMFFYVLFIVNLMTFWFPENGWAAQFLFIVIITEFLSGAVFPLDILPEAIQKVLYALPFPYLIFFPLQVYIGKISNTAVIQGLATGFVWLIILMLTFKVMWKKGVAKYSAEGR